MSKPIIFIIIDSVRSFKSGLDDRDRLDMMDKFGEESLEFTNAFCSAPSSVMSAASMFTGYDSAFISRNYNDWEFNTKILLSIQQILKLDDYDIFSIDNSRIGREIKKDLTLPLDKKFFPKNISHGKFWTNNDVNDVLKNVLKRDIKKKSFFMMWYDCRLDPATSLHVLNALEMFKKNPIFDDAITVVTADHGYPSPDTNLNQNTMRGLGHDLVLTDDNIRVPLFIRNKKFKPKKIDEVVGTIDLFPTLLSMAEVNFDKKILSNINGKNLVPLIKGEKYEERIIRTDCRLLLQPGRISSLRSKNFKYLYYYDTNIESLFDLENDKDEVNPLNLNDFGEVLKNFRKLLKESNDKIFLFHKKELELKIKVLIKKFFSKKDYRYSVLVCGNPPKTLVNFIKDYCDLNNVNIKYSFENEKELFINKFDYVLIILEKNNFIFNYSKINLKKYRYRNIIQLDYNLEIVKNVFSRYFKAILKYKRNWKFYKSEPYLLLQDIFSILKNKIKKLLFGSPEISVDMIQIKELRDRAIKAKHIAKNFNKDINK